MMNIDATFEVVKARQADLRLLAGPQPMIPFTEPPFDPLRRRVGQVMATLRTMLGVTRPTRPATGRRAPA
jgi:hypothetical protein